MMKKLLSTIPTLLVVLLACKSKEKKTEEGYFPVLTVIKGQINHIDTSLYQIVKYTPVDSVRSDTEYIRREDFRALAKDFLDIPDIAESSYNGRFEEIRLLDKDLGRVLITYVPRDPTKELIQRQEVLVIPSEGIGTMDNVIINYFSTTKDSSIEKKMLWKMNQYFQVTTIKQLPGKPETITTTKVVWNEPSFQ
jgi:hypothetical protein